MVKLEISTHSGDIDILKVETYDPEDIDKKRNDENLQSILIGRNSYSRIDLKNIKQITDEQVEVEQEHSEGEVETAEEGEEIEE